ncbi:hypothetical protein NL676_003130 [Syzygium grande]|nr:hypothetical protein NL676_003130 [Syzygium grande]
MVAPYLGRRPPVDGHPRLAVNGCGYLNFFVTDFALPRGHAQVKVAFLPCFRSSSIVNFVARLIFPLEQNSSSSLHVGGDKQVHKPLQQSEGSSPC